MEVERKAEQGNGLRQRLHLLQHRRKRRGSGRNTQADGALLAPESFGISLTAGIQIGKSPLVTAGSPSDMEDVTMTAMRERTTSTANGAH